MAKTSVLLPVYNGQQYLESAIQSVLSQDADFELLVQDDCSSDGTAEIARSFADPRVKYAVNPRNSGCWASLQAAADRAGGQLLRLFSHDDLMLAGDLGQAEKCLAENPDYGVTISDYEKVDSHGAEIGSSFDHKQLHTELPDRIRGSEAAWYLFRFGCISGTQSTITVRRTLFDAVGGFDTAMRFCGDFAFLAKSAPAGGLVYNRRIAAKIRFHPQQTSKDGRKHMAYLDEMREVLRRLLLQMDPGRQAAAARAFKWIYGHQLFDLAVKNLLKLDGKFLKRFHEEYGGRMLGGSALAWACKLPSRALRRAQ